MWPLDMVHVGRIRIIHFLPSELHLELLLRTVPQHFRHRSEIIVYICEQFKYFDQLITNFGRGKTKAMFVSKDSKYIGLYNYIVYTIVH